MQSHICQFHRALAEMLRESDEEVIIHVAARNNLAEKNGLSLDFADKVFDIPFERSPFKPKNKRALSELRKVINAEKYDIIHCNTPVGGILTRWAARKTRKKGTRVLYTAHGFHFYKGASKKNWMIYYPIEKFFARYTDVLITINEEDCELANKKFKCRVERVHGAGVDSNRYRIADADEKRRLREELSLSGKVIVCVGELLPNKNQAMLINAMPGVLKKIPDAQLIIAGNGSEYDKLYALIESLGLTESVRLLGYCTFMELYQRAADLSVSCSIREGLGLNLIEGMLSGNPVIATENRGHNELVKDGVNGFLVKQNDSEALAERIVQILSDDALAEKMSKEGYSVGMRYSFAVVKNELKEIYYGN